MMDGLQYTIDSGVGDVKVAEMRVCDLRVWLREREEYEKSLAAGEYDMIGDGFFEGTRLTDVAFMTNKSREELELLTPKQIDAVITKCKEVNDRFFAWRQSLLKMALETMALAPKTPPLPQSGEAPSLTLGEISTS